MQINIKELDFTVSINACHDEIIFKMQKLISMQIQFLNKFQHQINKPDISHQIINYVKTMTIEMQEIQKDIKSYFTDIGISFIFDFYHKIYTLIVLGFNFLCQALQIDIQNQELLKNKIIGFGNNNNRKSQINSWICKNCKLKQPKQENTTNPHNNNNNSSQQQPQPNKSSRIKQQFSFIEAGKYDYKIRTLQNQEQKLSQQIQLLYDKMIMQKQIVQNTRPSLVTRELEAMKDYIESLMESTNTVFEQSYVQKYYEFKNSVAQVKKPDDLVNGFMTSMTFSIKQKFVEYMSRAVKKIKNLQQKMKIEKNDACVQTAKYKQILGNLDNRKSFDFKLEKVLNNIPPKDRKNYEKFIYEMSMMQKNVNILAVQNMNLKNQLNRVEKERNKMLHDHETLLNLYSKKSYNFQIPEQWIQQHKKHIKAKNINFQQNHILNSKCIQVSATMVQMQTITEIEFLQQDLDNQIINVLKKNHEKMINKLNDKQKLIKEIKETKDNQLRQFKMIVLNFINKVTQMINEAEEVKVNQKDLFRISNEIQQFNQKQLNQKDIIHVTKQLQEKIMNLFQQLFSLRYRSFRQQSQVKKLKVLQRQNNNELNRQSKSSLKNIDLKQFNIVEMKFGQIMTMSKIQIQGKRDKTNQTYSRKNLSITQLNKNFNIFNQSKGIQVEIDTDPAIKQHAEVQTEQVYQFDNKLYDEQGYRQNHQFSEHHHQIANKQNKSYFFQKSRTNTENQKINDIKRKSNKSKNNNTFDEAYKFPIDQKESEDEVKQEITDKQDMFSSSNQSQTDFQNQLSPAYTESKLFKIISQKNKIKNKRSGLIVFKKYDPTQKADQSIQKKNEQFIFQFNQQMMNTQNNLNPLQNNSSFLPNPNKKQFNFHNVLLNGNTNGQLKTPKHSIRKSQLKNNIMKENLQMNKLDFFRMIEDDEKQPKQKSKKQHQDLINSSLNKGNTTSSQLYLPKKSYQDKKYKIRKQGEKNRQSLQGTNCINQNNAKKMNNLSNIINSTNSTMNLTLKQMLLASNSQNYSSTVKVVKRKQMKGLSSERRKQLKIIK